jgi:hypothetical protein
MAAPLYWHGLLTLTRRLLAAAALAMTIGCAAMDAQREYRVAYQPAVKIQTILTSGYRKNWSIYAHPSDASRILVTESYAASVGKAFVPFVDTTASPDLFDQAVETYLKLNRLQCEIARSTEIADLNAYEYHLRCNTVSP